MYTQGYFMEIFLNIKQIIIEYASVIAILISLLIWLWQIRLQRHTNEIQNEQLELQRGTSHLDLKLATQLAEIYDKKSDKAQLILKLTKTIDGHAFELINISKAEAKDITIEFEWPNSNDIPVHEEHYKRKFPAKVLHPGQSIELKAFFHFGSALAYNAVIKWTNPDGSKEVYPTYVAL